MPVVVRRSAFRQQANPADLSIGMLRRPVGVSRLSILDFDRSSILAELFSRLSTPRILPVIWRWAAST